ncbi:MAG: FAD-binding protein [Actinobacteria bacterium]|nr:FAD-binding protein [Actinomycetota bacterium]
MLADTIRRATEGGHAVRVAGAGHSSVPLAETDDILVSLEKFRGLESYNSTTNEATIQAGMTLHEAGKSLLDVGLALHNLGDVDAQTVVVYMGAYTIRILRCGTSLVCEHTFNYRPKNRNCHGRR